MPGDIVFTKTLNTDGSTRTVMVYATMVDEKIDKTLKAFQKPIPKGKWATPYVTKWRDMKKIRRSFEIRGWLDGTDENTYTQLASNVTASDTTIPVSSTSGFPSSGYIRIGNEIIAYTGTTSTSFTGCSRGQLGTGASAHGSGELVYRYQDVKGDLKAIVTDGGVATMTYNGETINVNFEKISIKETASDKDIKYEVMMSVVEGVDM